VVDGTKGLDEDDRALIARGRCLVVRNKCDLGKFCDEPYATSAITGEGLGELREVILETVAPKGAFEHETGFITSLRHERLLREAVHFLEKARDAAEAAIPHEMLLLDLYAGLRPIDGITGATTADDILNRIFSTFCIGK